MAISAERFKFLDFETNVAVTDFSTVTTSDVLNAPSPDTAGITADTEAISKPSALDSVKDLVKQAKDAAGTLKPGMDLLRKAKDIVSSVKNLKGMSLNSIDKLASTVLGAGSPQLSAFKGLSDTVKGNVASAMSLESQLKSKFQAGTSLISNIKGSGGDISGLGNLVNKLTNGNYASSLGNLIDTKNLEKSITGVIGPAMSAGLSGTFAAASTAFKDSPAVLSQAGANLFSMSCTANDINGMMEIGDSPIAGNLKSFLPDISKSALSNFKLPLDINPSGMDTLYSKFTSSLSNIDSNWGSSPSNPGLLSVANLDKENTDFNRVLEADYCSKPLTISDAVAADLTPPSALFMAGLISQKSTNSNPLLEMTESNTGFIKASVGTPAVLPITDQFDASPTVEQILKADAVRRDTTGKVVETYSYGHIIGFDENGNDTLEPDNTPITPTVSVSGRSKVATSSAQAKAAANIPTTVISPSNITNTNLFDQSEKVFNEGVDAYNKVIGNNVKLKNNFNATQNSNYVNQNRSAR